MAIAHGIGLSNDLDLGSAGENTCPDTCHVTSVTSLSARRNEPAALNRKQRPAMTKDQFSSLMRAVFMRRSAVAALRPPEACQTGWSWLTVSVRHLDGRPDEDDSERMADELRAEALKRIADLRSDARPPPLVFPCRRLPQRADD